jgi:hypothetical protein
MCLQFLTAFFFAQEGLPYLLSNSFGVTGFFFCWPTLLYQFELPLPKAKRLNVKGFVPLFFLRGRHAV